MRDLLFFSPTLDNMKYLSNTRCLTDDTRVGGKKKRSAELERVCYGGALGLAQFPIFISVLILRDFTVIEFHKLNKARFAHTHTHQLDSRLLFSLE